MTQQTLSDVMRVQLGHRSIRRYTDEPIPPETLEQIVRCGQAAATSSFIQAYSVVRVTDTGSRATIAKAAGGQVWVERAPEFLVFCADLRRIAKAAELVGAGDIEGYAEHGIVAIVDASLMAQNVLLAAESLGLGGVFIGGIRNDPQTVASELQLPHLVAPVFGMCLGWPDQEPEVKPRMPLASVLHQGRYDDASMEQEVNEYDEQMRAYYQARSSNTKISNWSEQTANAVQGKKREHMKAFLQSQGFFRR